MMLLSAKTFAQTQAFAISSISGILESKFQITRAGENMYNVNSVADTITLEEAQNIFALNVIGHDTNKKLVKLTVKDFAMFLQKGADTATYYSHSEMLPDEMKSVLKKIKPGTEIYFEYIRAMRDGFWSTASVIKYYVK